MGGSPEPASSSAARILLVEDDEHVRDVMAMVLGGVGYAVTVTGDGFEALWWLETQPYDLIISDLQLPGLDGPALHKEIIARWPIGGPRVLFTSGCSAGSRAESTPEARDVPVLSKPFAVDHLCDMVARALGAPEPGL